MVEKLKMFLGEDMLEVKNINKYFDERKVLNNVNFSAKEGDVVALLGEDGAGKSTLLRILCGFLEASSGEVVWENLNIKFNRIEFLENVGYVQEISSMYGDFIVYNFLKFVANIRKINENDIEDKIREVVELLDLKNVIVQKIETLSKGFKKRVELAAVLLSSPKILLLDEPTEGLDPNQKHSIRSIIKNYAKNHIVIMSTHTMEDVEAIASRVLLLQSGELRIDEKISDFKKISGNSLLKSFRKITKDEVDNATI